VVVAGTGSYDFRQRITSSFAPVGPARFIPDG
jgi:hypothetical protein